MVICSSRTSNVNNHCSSYWLLDLSYSVLASGLLPLSLLNAWCAYILELQYALLSPEIFGLWCLETDLWSCGKRVQRTAHGHAESGLSALLRTQYWGKNGLVSCMCNVEIKRIAVLSLKLGSLVHSCLRTQCGCKHHEVLRTVSENRLCFCVLFKIYLLILLALYFVSLMKWQIYTDHSEVLCPIKMPLCLLSGVEDILWTFCVASLSPFPVLQWR